MWWGFLSEAFTLHPVETGVHLHASCVALDGRGLLIAGASGSGKSSLALEMMALGAALVADDVTEIFAKDRLMARAPATLPHAIEARGLGLLPATLAGEVALKVAIDLDRRSAERMPREQHVSLLGHAIPLIHRPASGPVPAMLMQYLRHVG